MSDIDKCEVVRVASPESPGGFVVINASDFDKTKHKIFSESGPEQDEKPRKKGKI